MLQYIRLPCIYYPGKVKISDIKHRNKSFFVNFKVTGVTLGGMVGRCFVLLLSSSCKDPPVIGVPVAKKCLNRKYQAPHLQCVVIYHNGRIFSCYLYFSFLLLLVFMEQFNHLQAFINTTLAKEKKEIVGTCHHL